MNASEMVEVIKANGGMDLYGKTITIGLHSTGGWPYKARVFHVRQGENIPLVRAVLDHSVGAEKPQIFEICGDHFDELISPELVSIRVP